MNLDELISALSENAKDRFQIESPNDYSRIFLELTKDRLYQKKILRIQRIINSSDNKISTWKTLLFVELEKVEELKYALEWAALVKDSLLDPETADLYLFIIFENDVLNLERSLRIETSEQYCRKYVQRPNETVDELIERTFLGKIEGGKQSLLTTDPVNNALILTGNKSEWFTKEEQNNWKEIFLSSYTGFGLRSSRGESIWAPTRLKPRAAG